MTTKALQIFNSNTNPAIIDTTATFTDCSYLIFNPINLGGDDLEIAATIAIETIAEVEFPATGAIQPNTNLGTKEILLPIDFFDTATIIQVPLEATRPKANCRVCLSTSFSVFLEIYSVYSDNCDCEAKLQEILDEVRLGNAISLAIGVNQIAQNLVLLGTANLLGVALAPLTGGASTALPAVANTALPAGATTIIPLLLTTGIALPF